MSPLTPEVVRTKGTLDELVLAAPDPNAAMAAVVQVWALGGMAADDVLDDLEAIAVSAALHRGVELTAAELLDVFGQVERAQRIRDAVEAGRAAWWEIAARTVRLHEIAVAREAA